MELFSPSGVQDYVHVVIAGAVGKECVGFLSPVAQIDRPVRGLVVPVEVHAAVSEIDGAVESLGEILLGDDVYDTSAAGCIVF